MGNAPGKENVIESGHASEDLMSTRPCLSAITSAGPPAINQEEYNEGYYNTNKTTAATYLQENHFENLKNCAKLLTTFVNRHTIVNLDETPLEFFVHSQLHLTASNFMNNLQFPDLDYTLPRELVDNLYGLVVVLKQCQKDLHTATMLARESQIFIQIIAPIAQILEAFAEVPELDWTDICERFKKTESKRSPRILPIVGDLGCFTSLETTPFNGNFGSLRLLLGDTQVYAKLLSMSELEESNYTSIIRVYSAITRHPNISKMICCFPIQDYLFIAYEMFNGVNLQQVFKQTGGFSEDVTKIIVAQCGLALQYLHHRGFIHSDIRASSICIDIHGRIKLYRFHNTRLCVGKFVDRQQNSFNVRTYFELFDTSTLHTAAQFLPPEVLKEMPYGRSIDWYGLGILTYQCLTGSIPYHGFGQSLHTAIIKGDYVWPERSHSHEIKSFVKECLHIDSTQRLCSQSYSEFHDHKYFEDLDWSLFDSPDHLFFVLLEPVALSLAATDKSPSFSSPSPTSFIGPNSPELSDLKPLTDTKHSLFIYSSTQFTEFLHGRQSSSRLSGTCPPDLEASSPSE